MIMNQTDLIKIELTHGDASMFKKFQEHYDDFQILYEAGVWAIRNGGVWLNFDADGTLTEIKRNDTLYKRGFPIIQIVKFDL